MDFDLSQTACCTKTTAYCIVPPTSLRDDFGVA
jgi:hypothetical protein